MVKHQRVVESHTCHCTGPSFRFSIQHYPLHGSSVKVSAQKIELVIAGNQLENGHVLLGVYRRVLEMTTKVAFYAGLISRAQY